MGVHCTEYNIYYNEIYAKWTIMYRVKLYNKMYAKGIIVYKVMLYNRTYMKI